MPATARRSARRPLSWATWAVAFAALFGTTSALLGRNSGTSDTATRATPERFASPTASPRRLAPAGIFVAPGGSDKHGSGALDAPYRTVRKGAARARPGQTVWVRGGTYGKTVIKRKASADAPIEFKPYPGEAAMFDGSRIRLAPNDSLVTIVDSAHLVFAGFEIRNSRGRGLSVLDGRRLVVRDTTVHDTWAHPMMGSGKHLVFKRNHIYRGILSNRFGAKRLGYWPSALSTWTRSNGRRSRHVVFAGNQIHDTWGEGIIALHAEGVTVAHNTVYDVWSVGIYVTDAADVRVYGNHVYSTKSEFERNGRSAAGIMLANERRAGFTPQEERAIHDVLISNNVVVNSFSGVQYWHDRARTSKNSYRKIRVYYNVFKNSASAPLLVDAVPAAQRRPAGNVARNNVIYRGADRETVVLGNPSAWSLSHNDFPDGIPAHRGRSALAVDPMFTGATDSSLESFRLEDFSPLVDAGTPVGEVSTDIFGAPRADPPSIGVHESGAPKG